MIGLGLEGLLKAAGLPVGEADCVTFSGDDPVFPTSYRVGAAGAAALGAVGAAVSGLWRMRGGGEQKLSVDVRAAAASLRSAAYLRIDGEPPPSGWDPLSGFYPVRGGRWISIHCNFPAHREVALGVLGGATDRAGAEAASASWDGEALEDAIHAAGGCAGYVRDEAEWAAHPQALALAEQPLLVIRRIADAPPEPLRAGQRPLAGVRALDLTRVLAGPTATKTLAEHGAEVLKITATHLPSSGQADLDTGIGKLSAQLDLREDADRERLRALVGDADVFVQSYRPGALDGLGFGAEELARLRPGIISASLSAWGESGPWQARRGFDSIVQAVSGMAAVTGGDGPPRLLPVSAIDYVSGYLLALGVIVALQRRAEEGGSWHVGVALARVGRWIDGLGRVEGDLRAVPADLSPDEIAALTETRTSPAGELHYLRPVLQLSDTPRRWERPPVPLGYHKAEWPAR